MGPGAAFAAGLLLGGAAAGAAAWLLLRSRSALYGRLFSFAMHELNTPVTAVNMTVMNLLEGVFGELPAAQRPWVEMTREQVGRLNALVGEIRDLVHMELHKEIRLNVVDASPKDLVEEAVAALRQGFTLAGVELAIDVPAALPDVRADSDRAARSLTSLLFHARKFRKGGPVALTAKSRDGRVDFTVAYDGPVLAASEAQASLELFYPARPRKDHQLAATGLGLGLVRAIMAKTDGRLSFDVDGGGKARLVLSLPEARG
jgi:signal transduction histidine kinase